MFGWRRTSQKVVVSIAGDEPHPDEAAQSGGSSSTSVRDTSDTRRAARNDLLAGIGNATDSNFTLGKILRDAFGVVDEMAAFSSEFDATAEMTRTRANQFVAAVSSLQSQSDIMEERLAGAAEALGRAQGRSRSALTSVEDLTKSIDDIERVVKMIAGIASQTNLLALNATIEAARAGAAGAGFSVVAGEVKALSQATEKATGEIVTSVKRIRDRARINMAEVREFDQTVESIEGVFHAVRSSVVAQSEQTREIGVGSDELATLAQNVRASAGRMQTLGGTVKTMGDLAEKAAGTARLAFASLSDKAAIVLRHGADDELDGDRRWPIALSGRLTDGDQAIRIRVIDLSHDAIQIEIGADFPKHGLGETVGIDVDGIGRFDIRLLTPTTSGYETVLVNPPAAVLDCIDATVKRLRVKYQPYIDSVRAIADKVSVTLEQAIEAGDIASADLFDTTYRRDGATEPAQYLNAAVVPLETFMRPFIEDALTSTHRPDFCLLQDRNGFAALHNLHCSRPPRVGDVVWNLRHARARRIFDDRVGMAAGRNLQPFLVQSYARDMGDAIEVRMEFDAPVFINERHWGAVRMAYKLVEDSLADKLGTNGIAAKAGTR